MSAYLVRLRRGARVIAAAAVCLMPLAWPAGAQDTQSGNGDVYRVQRPNMPDVVVRSMSADRGRTYFGSRACVVCHRVNGIGGDYAPALDSAVTGSNGKAIDVFDFFSRIWRGAGPMVALQESLLGEPLDIAPDELADIAAFLHDPAEQKKFSEKDIPGYIRDFMRARANVPRR